VTESLAKLGLAAELVDGVDGWELVDHNLRLYSRRRAIFETGRQLTRGELGCALAHLHIYEHIVSECVPMAVVMEDDVQPTPDLRVVLDAAETFPSDWDVVTLHSLFPSADPEPISDRTIAAKYRICTYRRMVYGSQCYMLRERAARRLLDVGYPVRIPADDLIFATSPARLRVYGVEPSAVVVGDFPSELVARGESGAAGAVNMNALDHVIRTAGRVWRRTRRDGGSRGTR
jgi:glycosyl transferase family 25